MQFCGFRAGDHPVIFQNEGDGVQISRIHSDRMEKPGNAQQKCARVSIGIRKTEKILFRNLCQNFIHRFESDFLVRFTAAFSIRSSLSRSTIITL